LKPETRTLKPLVRWPHLLVFALLLGVRALHAGAPDTNEAPGEIQFSDGTVWQGRLFFAPEARLQVQAAGRLVALTPADIREIRFTAISEQMEQSWRFVEAGQVRKERWGDPYPVRQLQASIWLAGGACLTGHLYTVPLYVERDGGTEKVVLSAKQRGQPGESLTNLVYPARLVWPAARASGEGVARIRLPADLAGPGREVKAMVLASLLKVPVQGMGDGLEYGVGARPGDELVVAVRDGLRVAVGWPAGGADLAPRIEAALADVRDFFDQRRVIAVTDLRPDQAVYALMLLWREGATTLDGPSNRPWHVEVWRWKMEPDSGRLMLAARGSLFEGLGRVGERPEVRLVPAPDIRWHKEE
jgi:hypothetical protein